MIIHLVNLIHDFGYLLTAYDVPCTILDAWNTLANKTDNFMFFRVYILVKEIEKRKQKKPIIK